MRHRGKQNQMKKRKGKIIKMKQKLNKQLLPPTHEQGKTVKETDPQVIQILGFSDTGIV